jgi:hypothetical protein
MNHIILLYITGSTDHVEVACLSFFESKTGDYHFALRCLDENETALPVMGRASYCLDR